MSTNELPPHDPEWAKKIDAVLASDLLPLAQSREAQRLALSRFRDLIEYKDYFLSFWKNQGDVYGVGELVAALDPGLNADKPQIDAALMQAAALVEAAKAAAGDPCSQER